MQAKISKNTALIAALNTQFLIQIGVFTAVPMVLGFILEQGFLRVNMDSPMCAFFYFVEFSCIYPLYVPKEQFLSCLLMVFF